MKKGSSPLTRGKLACVIHCARAIGLIPAHAGKTVTVRELVSKERAHPRSRGENQLGAVIGWPRKGLIPAHAGKTDGVGLPLPLEAGSSPLTRGKPASPRSSRKKIGLIPAHAGKTGDS